MRQAPTFRQLLADVADSFDADDALGPWRWLVPQNAEPYFLTALGDLFMTVDEKVFRLDTTAGIFEQVADSREQLAEVCLKDQLFVTKWFLPAFVAELIASGAVLQPGECFSPTIPPVLGGRYTVENWAPTHWRVHFHTLGQVHEQVKDLPDGTVLTNG